MQAASTGDARAAYAADLAFHTTLVELTEDGRLLASFNRSAPMLRALIPLDEFSYRSLDDMAEEHRRLLQAIENDDEDGAARCAEQHLEEGAAHVVDRLRATQTGAEAS